MAYGQKYQLKFTNRVQNDVWYANFMFKDYTGDSTDLNGSETPITISYTGGDGDVLTPIQPLEITISFVSNTISIENFYSDDDQFVRIDVYHETTPSDKLMYVGYLIQDGISEAITDFKHVITLKATDNLALLKNKAFNEVAQANFEALQWPLNFFIKSALYFTGLYSQNTTIDLSLPYRSYDNLFENSEDDRADDPLNDPLSQAVIYPQLFKNSDNTWQDCYSVIERILTDKNLVLFQAEGYWNVVRRPEYIIFDGAIPGTEYVYNGSGTDFTALTMDSFVDVNRKGDGDCYPIEEDQLKTIQRPVKSVLQTFNYNNFNNIIQSDLQLPEGATPFETSTTDGIRTDKYDLDTYFPHWKRREDDNSYLVIKTDTNLDPENEIDRYIRGDEHNDTNSGIEFNPISVSAGDNFDFSLSFKTDASSGFFFVRFLLITSDGNYYSIEQNPIDEYATIEWQGPNTANEWFSESLGLHIEETTDSDWNQFTFTRFDTVNTLIPADGMLLIQVTGNNSTWDAGMPGFGGDSDWKDIRLTLSQFINSSTQIVGHLHTSTGNSLIKAIQEGDRTIDDSPRRTIAGTLFTSDTTNFDFTDTATGEETEIGAIYFTPTTLWHRGTLTEELRLGEAITDERLSMNYVNRQIVDGTFRNLTIASGYVSMLSLFTFHFSPGRYFLAASITFDLMNASFNGRFIEIINTGLDMEGLGLMPFEVEEQPEPDVDVPFDSVTGTGWIVYDATHLQYNGVNPWVAPFTLNISGGWVNSVDGFQIRLLSTSGVIAATIVSATPFDVEVTGSGTFYTGDLLSVEVISVDGSFEADTFFSVTAMTVTSNTGDVEDPGDYTFKYIYENANS